MSSLLDKRWKRAIALLAVAAALVAVFIASGSDEPADEPAPPPEYSCDEDDVSETEQTTSTVLTEPMSADPGQVDASVTVGDPVPDELVTAFFAMIEDAGSSPLMNETYTVEFRETTDDVYIEGEFEDGSHVFEFAFEDGEWKLEVGS